MATVSSLVCLFYVPLLLYEPNISEDFLLAMHKIYKQTLHIDCKPMALLGSLHGTMVDFGEIIPDEAVFYDGRTGDEMHNAYALDYTKAYRKLFEKYKGEDHVLFSRSAAAGVQKYSCQFGGDQLSSFRGLTYAMNGGLTLAASGFPKSTIVPSKPASIRSCHWFSRSSSALGCEKSIAHGRTFSP